MAHLLAGVGFDLHTHSAFSDGTTSPTEIAAEAAAVGLAGFALTDHDTITGWEEARAAAAAHRVSFLPGIEITTKHNGASRHLLGYGIDPAHGELFAALGEVQVARLTRLKEMVRRVAVDYAITLEDVVGAGDVATVGRPHIADALVAKGYFADRSTAFEEILHPRSPYYLGTLAIDTREAIRLVTEAGGVSVLAHPAAFRQRAAIATTDIAELAASGLWGIETDHPENRADWMPPIVEAAARLGLETTGSSDYHGAGKPNRLGAHRTQAAVVARLRERVTNPQ
ncbi:PHP domain-containing protein [Leucobacter sp. HY1908]